MAYQGAGGRCIGILFLFHLRTSGIMRQQVGFLLQLAVLSLLPVLILWQLNFHFPLIWMPGLLVVGIVLFWIGRRLRES